MEAVAETQHVQMMAHDQFRLRILRPDLAHGFAALFWRDGIHIVDLVVVIGQPNNIAWLFFQTINGYEYFVVNWTKPIKMTLWLD